VYTAFEQELTNRGWRIGENITIEYLYAEGHLERLPALAAELVDHNVELIFAVTAPETRAAKAATRTIPIVFAAHGDPVASGDVLSFAHPGGNATGLSQMHPELGRKQLEFLKACVPHATRIAVLWNPTSPVKVHDWRELNPVAQALGISLLSSEVRTSGEVHEALDAMARQSPDALLTLGDPLTFQLRATIATFATAQRLSAMYPYREFVEVGGLMSYGPDHVDLFRRAADFVDKILKGSKPEDLPVEQPTKFESVINLKTAKAIGLTIPPLLLAGADEVIE
jgi:putative ABC transport system substrate-binding protein